MTVALDRVEVLLLDADDCLFGSEIPAYVASTAVTNRLLEALGVDRRFGETELRRWAAGRNFRAVATTLAAEHGAPLEPAALEWWVAEERRSVVAHLGTALAPDDEITAVLERLAERFRLAVVSSSALGRLDACFEATGLAGLLPPDARFSAEDSLPAPAGKPDPAVYRHAGAALGVAGDRALAVEDSVSGVRSARAAGFPVVGNLRFVPGDERAERTAALLEAGAQTVVSSWPELEALLPGVLAEAAP